MPWSGTWTNKQDAKPLQGSLRNYHTRYITEGDIIICTQDLEIKGSHAYPYQERTYVKCGEIGEIINNWYEVRRESLYNRVYSVKWRKDNKRSQVGVDYIQRIGYKNRLSAARSASRREKNPSVPMSYSRSSRSPPTDEPLLVRRPSSAIPRRRSRLRDKQSSPPMRRASSWARHRSHSWPVTEPSRQPVRNEQPSPPRSCGWSWLCGGRTSTGTKPHTERRRLPAQDQNPVDYPGFAGMACLLALALVLYWFLSRLFRAIRSRRATKLSIDLEAGFAELQVD